MRWLVLVGLVGCSAPAATVPPAPTAPAPHQHTGGRDGSHGMVLFGKKHHYLEHIPMFAPPHDKQIVMRVTVRDAQGRVLDRDFSDTGYSIEPASKFSLDELAQHVKTSFTGDIHRGNFEQGGPVVAKGVTITVDDVLVARDLPGDSPITAGDQEYFLVGEPGDAYLTNFIRISRGFQQILRVGSIAGITPTPSRVQRILASAPERLTTGNVDTADPNIQLVVAAELWCLTAPDFLDNCP